LPLTIIEFRLIDPIARRFLPKITVGCLLRLGSQDYSFEWSSDASGGSGLQ